MGVKQYLLQIQTCLETLELCLEGALSEIEAASEIKKRSFRPKGAIDELNDEILLGFLSTVTQELQRDWLVLYQDAKWIKEELKKAKIWHVSKARPPKNIGLFCSNWLSKAQKPKKPSEVASAVSYYSPKY
ncbi:MAG: hypothetical protein ACK5RO_11005 [Pseudobdellovibrionaceae bacterium]|jgi:hypothetical protein|nr:hypothetical protein [Pseudanabaena sp. M151S2SP2A07QC]